MFEIIYSISEAYKQSDVDYEFVDEGALRYELFLGSLFLYAGDSKIELDWGWIPLLDFASSFLWIYLDLLGKLNYCYQFDFTESDGALLIKRNGEKIIISTSYSDEKIKVSLYEFWKGISRFYMNLIQYIRNQHPEIDSNDNFSRYVYVLKNIMD